MTRAQLVSDLKTLCLGRSLSWGAAHTDLADETIVGVYLAQIQVPNDPGTVARALTLVDAGIVHSRTSWLAAVLGGAAALTAANRSSTP